MAIFAAMLLMGFSGCGTTKTARLTAWRAAQFDVGGVERLAVLGFRAPAEVASLAKEATLEKLHQSRFYQIVPEVNAGRYKATHLPLPDEPDGLHQIVSRGRQLNADAVLVGRVRKRIDDGKKIGNVTLQIGDPELAIKIDYYIVDMRSGNVRARQSVIRTQKEEGLASDRRLSDRAVDSLVKQCAEEMVSQITAGSETIDVQLARVNMGKGSSYIRDGNKLAGKGKWEEAAEEYIAAVEVNPDSHQAIYNVGLAAEAQGRFGEAEEMYRKAIMKSDESIYRDALARVSNTGNTYQLAQQQIVQRPRWRFRPGDQFGYQQTGPPAGRRSRHVNGGVPKMRHTIPNRVAHQSAHIPQQDSQHRWDSRAPVRPERSYASRGPIAHPDRRNLPAQNPSNSQQYGNHVDSGFQNSDGSNHGEFRP